MSQLLINQFLNDLDRYGKFSGSFNEGVTSEAFKDLSGSGDFRGF